MTRTELVERVHTRLTSREGGGVAADPRSVVRLGGDPDPDRGCRPGSSSLGCGVAAQSCMQPTLAWHGRDSAGQAWSWYLSRS
jgi:hypothetical protein